MRGLAVALLGLGIADVVWINADLGPRALQGPNEGEATPPPTPEPVAQEVQTPPTAVPPEPEPAALETVEIESAARPTPAPPAVAAAAPRSRVVTFAYGMDTLDGTAESELDEAVAALVANPDLELALVGHTDVRGGEDANFRLGLRRARTVERYLVRHGVDAGRITAESVGEGRPRANEESEDAFRLNRRVELTFSAEGSR